MKRNKKLKKALKSSDIATLNELKNDGYNFSKIDIVDYVESGADKEVLEFLLNNGVNANAASSDGDTVLMEALWESIDIVELLIKYGADVNGTSEYGKTVLMEAVKRSIDTAELLIKHGADVNATSEYGKTVLMEAVPRVILDSSKINILELLIKHDADVNATSKNGKTVLMETVDYVTLGSSKINTINILELLIKHGADVNATSSDGITALMWAVEEASIDIIKLLIKHGADVNATSSGGFTALMQAVEKASIDIIKLLIKHGADVNASVKLGGYGKFLPLSSPYNSLYYAVKENHVEVVKFLLEHGSIRNILIVDDALKNNNIEIIQLLIDHGLEIQEVFQYYISNSKINLQTLQLFIDSDIDIYFKDFLSLFILVVHDTTMAKLLISKTTDSRFFPMFYTIAQHKNNSEVLSFLEEKGISTGNYNFDVRMSLFMHDKMMPILRSFSSSFSKKLKIMKYGKIEGYKKLLDNVSFVKPRINISKEISKEIKNNSDIVFLEMLIQKQQNINEADEDGMTNLMWACKLNNIEVVKLLLKYKVDNNITSNEGKTALQYAVGKQEITSMLRDYHRLRLSNNPKELVKILTNFTKDTPIKYTTHNWDFGKISKTEHKNFQGFMDAIRKQWRKLEDDLLELSPNLHKKIYTFLLNDNKEADSWCEKADISIGWSSLEGLEKWCDDGKDPYKFKLDTPYIVDNKEISTFEDVINLFKQEIENRKEHHMLKKYFIDMKKSLDEYFTITFENFREDKFYTDIEIFKLALTSIFAEIRTRDFPQIIVSAINDTEGKYIDIVIVQKGSEAQQNSEGMLREVEKGHFIGIKTLFSNLCDWSIESSYEGENYRVNYLRSDKNIPEIEPLDYEPDGFTHKLRFYKG